METSAELVKYQQVARSNNESIRSRSFRPICAATEQPADEVKPPPSPFSPSRVWREDFREEGGRRKTREEEEEQGEAAGEADNENQLRAKTAGELDDKKKKPCWEKKQQGHRITLKQRITRSLTHTWCEHHTPGNTHTHIRPVTGSGPEIHKNMQRGNDGELLVVVERWHHAGSNTKSGTDTTG